MPARRRDVSRSVQYGARTLFGGASSGKCCGLKLMSARCRCFRRRRRSRRRRRRPSCSALRRRGSSLFRRARCCRPARRRCGWTGKPKSWRSTKPKPPCPASSAMIDGADGVLPSSVVAPARPGVTVVPRWSTFAPVAPVTFNSSVTVLWRATAARGERVVLGGHRARGRRAFGHLDGCALLGERHITLLVEERHGQVHVRDAGRRAEVDLTEVLALGRVRLDDDLERLRLARLDLAGARHDPDLRPVGRRDVDDVVVRLVRDVLWRCASPCTAPGIVGTLIDGRLRSIAVSGSLPVATMFDRRFVEDDRRLPGLRRGRRGRRRRRTDRPASSRPP